LEVTVNDKHSSLPRYEINNFTNFYQFFYL
jgi:hypothetical protein